MGFSALTYARPGGPTELQVDGGGSSGAREWPLTVVLQTKISNYGVQAIDLTSIEPVEYRLLGSG
eukprot:458720-Prymnesium_polylepis.1